MQPFDASVLIDIWLDGYTTASCTLAVRSGMSEEDADKFADEMVQQLMNDPAGMELVRSEVSERIRGIEGSPRTMKLASK